MNILKKSAAGYSLCPLETELLEQRKIYLTGAINNESLQLFLQQIEYLKGRDPEAPITVYIDSPGGEVSSGLAIRDILKGLSMEVTLVCVHQAASMAAILLAAGQRGRRLILRHSTTMIHEPLLKGDFSSSATEVKKTADKILRTKALLVDMLVQDTGKTREEIEEAISFDNEMDAEESVTFGLADRVIDTL